MSASIRAFASSGEGCDAGRTGQARGRRCHRAGPGLQPPSRLRRFFDSDLLHSFLGSKLVVLAGILTLVLVGAAFLAPLIAPHNPYDLKALSLLDSNLPPMWETGGEPGYPLGT